VPDESRRNEMLELVERYSELQENPTRKSKALSSSSDGITTGEVVVSCPYFILPSLLTPWQLLTGATGSLGSHILSQLFKNSALAQVYCLVRPNSAGTAEERVLSGLKQRLILPKSHTSLDKLRCLPAQLEEDNLGLDASVYEKLHNEVSTIIHVSSPERHMLQR